MLHAREPAPGQRPEGPGRADRPARHGVLALQQAAGNRAVGQALARKATATNTVQIGKLKITVTGGNIAEWAAGKVPDFLDVSSEKGRHSGELEALSKERTKVPSLKLTVPVPGAEGQQLDLGSLAIEITNGRIKDYKVAGTTESWRVVDFDGVHRTKTTHKVS
jgi:hypothetical protein